MTQPMRIRLWQAFASNNSGSYTLVGVFDTPEEATSVARAMQRVLGNGTSWYGYIPDEVLDAIDAEDAAADAAGEGESNDADADDGPPLVLGEEIGYYNRGPGVEASGRKVVVYVGYTLGLPREVPKYMFDRGGRVEAEIEHFGPVITVFSFWSEVPAHQRDAAAIEPQFERLRLELLDDVIPKHLVDPYSARKHPPVAPVWRSGTRAKLFAVLGVVTEGIAAVRACAERHGVEMDVQISEALTRGGDPLAHLRTEPAPFEHDRTGWQVVLWKPGSDLLATARTLRDEMGCTVPEVMAVLRNLPATVREGLTEEAARTAASHLRSAGAEAQAIRPERTPTQ